MARRLVDVIVYFNVNTKCEMHLGCALTKELNSVLSFMFHAPWQHIQCVTNSVFFRQRIKLF